MVRRCVVPGCNSRVGKGNKTLYKFPKDTERRAKWLKSIGIPLNEYIRSSWCVCEVHFDINQWEPKGDRRLKQTAVPYLTEIDTNNTSSFGNCVFTLRTDSTISHFTRGHLLSLYHSSSSTPANLIVEQVSTSKSPEEMQPEKPPDGTDQSEELNQSKEESNHDSLESLEDEKEYSTENMESKEASCFEKDEMTPTHIKEVTPKQSVKDAEVRSPTNVEKDAEERMGTNNEKDIEETTQTNKKKGAKITLLKDSEILNEKVTSQDIEDDIEAQMTMIHSDGGAEMIQIHDESFLQDDGNIHKETDNNQAEEIHTEVDLTNVDLESQRLSGLCRVCAVSSSRLIPVFGNEKSITEKIHTFLPILVTPEDLLPVSICKKCLASLEQSQKLVQICLEADKKLKDLLESKLSGSQEIQLKSEKEDVEEIDDYCMGCDDDEPNRPSTPFSPPVSSSPPPSQLISPKREAISPEPTIVSAPKTRSKAAETSTPKTSKDKTLHRELIRLETDMVTSKDRGNDSRSPNILRRRTRRSAQENLSPTILEKMRSYGIKDSSVVMTKVDIPQNTQSAVITTVSVPITKDKPKNRTGPKRLYRCLYCSETGSDAYKLLLHQMKMHPGNLLKCPHCGFVCGSDQKAKFDAHVLAHGVQDSAKKPPEVIDISSEVAEPPRSINGPVLPQPVAVTPSGSGRQSKNTAKPKSLLKEQPKRAFNRGPRTQKKGGLPALAPAPLTPVTQVLTQIPGSAMLLKIAVDGKAAGNGAQPTPTAIIPVTLYQCARCRLNFNTKEGVETHACVVKPAQPNLVPIAPKPGGLPLLVPIAPKPGNISYPCTTCGMIFDESPLLREHMLTHQETFKCDICGNTFRSEFHLKAHAKKHNPEKNRFECPHCDKVYTVKSRLRTHLYSHSNEPRCVCPQCGKVFRTDGGFRNHLKAHENKRAFACGVCGLRFNRRGNMRRHERNCTGKKSLTCKYCCERFEQHDDLLVHRASAHADLEISEKIPDVSTGDKQKRYTCKVCSEGFVRVMDMRKHQVEKHTEEELAKVKDIPDGGAYLCHTCGKQIHHKHNYKLHMMHHQGKALFKCDQCDRTFTSKFALNYHHMLHTGDFPFKCSLCTESFRSSVALQVHRFKHTGEKPYRCRSCDMGFFTSHSLRLHQIVHSNERNYVCKVCGSTFKRSKTLRYHSLIHTGEKPYECRICGKAFRQKGTCNIHERNHAMANRKTRSQGSRQIISMELEDDDNEEYEHLVEEETNPEMEDEAAAEMVEMEVEEEEIETTVEQVEEVGPPEKQAQIWRITDPKVHYRIKNIDWKQATSSQGNEAVYILRESESMKEGLPEVCSVSTGGAVRLAEVAEGGLISMYPDIDIQDTEVVTGEKTIEFNTPDGTIRIIH